MGKIDNLTIGTSKFQDFSVTGFAQAMAASVGGSYQASVVAANALVYPVFVSAQAYWNYLGTATTSSFAWTATVTRARDGFVLQTKSDTVFGNGSKIITVKFDLSDADAQANETYVLTFSGVGNSGGSATGNTSQSFINVLYVKK